MHSHAVSSAFTGLDPAARHVLVQHTCMGHACVCYCAHGHHWLMLNRMSSGYMPRACGTDGLQHGHVFIGGATLMTDRFCWFLKRNFRSLSISFDRTLGASASV